MVQLGLMQADGGNGDLLNLAQLAQQAQAGPTQITKAPEAPASSVPIGLVIPESTSSGAAGGGMTVQDPSAGTAPPNTDSGPALVQLSVSGTGGSQTSGLSAPWHPAAPSGGGGAMPRRGGSGGPSAALVAAATPGRSSGGSSNAGASTPDQLVVGRSVVGPVVGPRAWRRRFGSAPSATPGSAAGAVDDDRQPQRLGHDPDSGGAAHRRTTVCSSRTSARHLSSITLDYNDGSVMVPGHDQLATPGGSVNLMAQVRDSATGTYTYSWDTTGLSDATSISGSSTSNLTFSVGYHDLDGHDRVRDAHCDGP